MTVAGVDCVSRLGGSSSPRDSRRESRSRRGMDAIRLPPHLRANLSRERKLMRCGHGTIAGIDEVGRGPLAGPVVAAAVVLDLKRVPKGLADSKVLTLEEREALFEQDRRDGADRHRLDLASRDRRHQHPPGVALGDVPGARRAARAGPTSRSSTATTRRACRAGSRPSSRATPASPRSPPPRSSPRWCATG